MTNHRDALHVAVAMHETLCGSWDAAGHQVKVSFFKAADAALDALAADGWDLFAYPDGGWAELITKSVQTPSETKA